MIIVLCLLLLTTGRYCRDTLTDDTYMKVGLYLKAFEQSAEQEETAGNLLPNSNKIGQGYNPLRGNPVCYTSRCQMEGFRLPVFSLEYQSPSAGACTTALVPDFVMVDCLPGIVTSANTEVISTLKQLSESMSKRIEASVGVSFGPFSFSYSHSTETTYMVDNIVQNALVLSYTSVEVSHVKLTMFEPLMKLSEPFRYVIENLPCCDNADEDWMTEKYIRDFILDYFGYTYVSTLLLGGIAQENIFLSRSSHQKLESQGISVTNAAKVSFYVSVGVSVTDTQSSKDYQALMKEVQSSFATKLGGDPSKVQLDQWVRSVPSNPVVIKFGIRNLLDLLTSARFSNDAQIHNKSKLIEKILKKYLQHPLYCHNNCSDPTRGKCQESGYFQYGLCECNVGWAGADCSIRVTTAKPSVNYGDVLSGTLCGYDRSYVRVNCNGLRPWNECPAGWIKKTWVGADFTVCYKAITSKNDTSITGTLCGLYNTGSKHTAQIPCNNILAGTCPNLLQAKYQKHSSSFSQGSTSFCYKLNSGYNDKDLPGTLCGIQWESTNDGPPCDGFNPGLFQCPPHYKLDSWTLETGKRFFLCVKL
jgi:hypothetical protein